MIRTLARWVGRAALGTSAAALLAVALLHTPPGQNLLRYLLLGLLRRGGMDARLLRLEVAPLRLEAEVFGLELRAPGAPPFLTLARARVRLPARALLGRPGTLALEAEGLEVTLERGEGGEWNLPAAVNGGGPTSVNWRPWLAAPVQVRGATLRAHDDTQDADLAAVGLRLAWSGRTGVIEAPEGIFWRLGDREGRVAVRPVQLESDGASFRVNAPEMRAPEGSLRLDATIAPLVGVPGLAASADGRVLLQPLLGPPWSGALLLKARAHGALTEPDLDLDACAEGLGHGSLVVAGSAAAQVRGEKTRVSLDLRTAEGTLTAEADLLPRGNRATVVWNGLDLETLAGPSVPLSGRIAGTLRARWPPAQPMRGEVDAEWKVEPAKGAGASRLAVGGHSTFTVRNGRYVADLDHSLGESTQIEGRLEGNLDAWHPERIAVEGPLRVRVTRLGELARGAGLTTVPVEGRLDALLAVTGSLSAPIVAGTLTTRDLVMGGAPAVDADARLRVAGRTLRARLLEARGGGATARGRLEVDEGGRATGRFEGNVPRLAAWAGALPPGWSPEGAATFEAVIDGPAARPGLDLRLHGQGIALLGQPRLPAANARFHVSAAGLRLDALTLDQGEGRLQIAGSLEPPARHLRIEARSFAFQAVAAGVLGEAGLPLRGQVDGQLDLTIDGDQATGGGRLELRDLSFSGRALGDASLDVASEGTRVTAEAHLPALSATATARVGVVAPFPISATVGLVEADLAALARAAGIPEETLSGTVSLRATLDGEAAHLSEGTVAVDLRALEGALHELPFRLLAPARARADAKTVSIEDLRVDVAGGQLTADGALDGAGGVIEARFHGPLRGLGPLLAKEGDKSAPTLEGEADITMALRGTRAEPRPEARAQVRSGVVTRGATELLRGLELDASFQDGVFQVARLSGIARDVRGELTGRAGTGLLVALPEGVRRFLGGDTHAAAHLRLRGEPGTDREGLLVEGEMTADAPSLDRVRAQARVEGLQFEAQGAKLRQDEPFTLELGDGRLLVPTAIWRGGGNDLRLGGEAWFPQAVRPLGETRLDLRAEGGLDLRLLNAFGRGLEAGGTARVEASVKGSLLAPSLEGDLRLEGAVVRYRPLRLALDDVNAYLRATPGRLALEAMSGTFNGGTVEGGGAVVLEGMKPASGVMSLKVRGAALDWPKGLRGTADADLELRGTSSGPVLGGAVTVAGAHYKGDPRTLVTHAGPRLAPAEPGSAPATLGLDLRLRTLDDVRVDNPFGVFAFSFDVTATGTTQAPRLGGQVELAPGGYVYWSGRRFTVERARLDWSGGGTSLVPFVQARSTARVSSYLVTADFSGPVDRAEARLGSDPPLSTAEIASLLVTGSTRAGATDSRALGIASANFLGNLGRVAGLDSVRLDTGEDQSLLDFDPARATAETNPAQRLTITKRLAANLEVTVSLNLSESGKTTTFVSYKPRPAFEVRLAQRDDYTGSLELRHDVAFGATDAPSRARARGVRAEKRGREKVESVHIEDDSGEPPAWRPKLRLGPGQTFTYEAWQRDRNRLEEEAGRQGFAEAYVLARREPRVSPPEGGPVALTYVVRRGLRTTLTVTGLALPESVRRELQRAWSQGDYSSSIEDEALLRARAALSREGHFTPRLTARLETSEDGSRKDLVLAGERGEKARSRRVEFFGATAIPRDRLEDLVKGKDLLAQAWNDPRALERALTVLYRREGYLATLAEAKEPVVVDGVAVLKVEVTEGPLFRLGDVQVEGCAAVSCAQALSALALPPGQAYREAETDAARERLQALYKGAGFGAVRAEIAGTIDVAKARVDLRATVREGPKQVLEQVVVEGGDPATRRALTPLLRLTPGQPVVAEEWAAARKRVYETGLVRGVGLDPVVTSPAAAPLSDAGEGPPATESVTARLTLEKWPALRLRYGLQLVTEEPLSEGGSNTVDLGGTLELSRATLFGNAISSALYAEARASTWAVRGAFSAPRTFGRTLRTSLYVVREKEDLDLSLRAGAAPIRSKGDSLELTLEERFRPGRKVGFALAYAVQWLDLTFPELELAPLSFRPARLIGTVTADGRSNILDPKKGYFSSLSVSYGDEFLGSDVSFTKTFAQQFFYLPLGKGLLSASGARYERGSGNQSFLTTERLSLGGPTTVRGYDRETVDLAELFVLQGTTTQVLVLNQELRFPIWSDLRGVAFLDYGKLRARLDGSAGSFSRLGTGLGLRYSTAVGVLRIDVGYALKDGDRRPRFYVGLGQAF